MIGTDLSLVDFSSAGLVKVACIGDSITYGYGLVNRAETAYPACLQRLLGTSYAVRAFGRCGAGYFRDGTNGYVLTAEHAQALAWKPAIVICNLGINDADAYARLSRNGRCERFYSDVVALLQAYRALPSDPKIFLWTKLAPILPCSPFADATSPAPFLMQRELARAAEACGAVGIDMHSALVPRQVLQADGTHPTAAGAERIAQETYRVIKPFLIEHGHEASRGRTVP